MAVVIEGGAYWIRTSVYFKANVLMCRRRRRGALCVLRLEPRFRGVWKYFELAHRRRGMRSLRIRGTTF